MFSITEHVAKTERHTTFYFACGRGNGPLLIFVPQLARALDQLAAPADRVLRAWAFVLSRRTCRAMTVSRSIRATWNYAIEASVRGT
jgi:hypothetical protein